MGIDAIHLNRAMTGIQDYNTMRNVEESKNALDQNNFHNQFSQKVDDKHNQVQQKDTMDNSPGKFDAKDKGSNSYEGDGGKGRREDSSKKDTKSLPHLGHGFDMKI